MKIKVALLSFSVTYLICFSFLAKAAQPIISTHDLGNYINSLPTKSSPDPIVELSSQLNKLKSANTAIDQQAALTATISIILKIRQIRITSTAAKVAYQKDSKNFIAINLRVKSLR
jgi:hypothetical protein